MNCTPKLGPCSAHVLAFLSRGESGASGAPLFQCLPLQCFFLLFDDAALCEPAAFEAGALLADLADDLPLDFAVTLPDEWLAECRALFFAAVPPCFFDALLPDAA